MSDSNWWYPFHKRSEEPETQQPGLEFDNFKPRRESFIFECIFWLNSSFLGVMIEVF
jgi:hypothetical protein